MNSWNLIMPAVESDSKSGAASPKRMFVSPIAICSLLEKGQGSERRVRHELNLRSGRKIVSEHVPNNAAKPGQKTTVGTRTSVRDAHQSTRSHGHPDDDNMHIW